MEETMTIKKTEYERAGSPCSYQIYSGDMIGTNRDYFANGKDFSGNALTYEFFLLPSTVR